MTTRTRASVVGVALSVVALTSDRGWTAPPADKAALCAGASGDAVDWAIAVQPTYRTHLDLAQALVKHKMPKRALSLVRRSMKTVWG